MRLLVVLVLALTGLVSSRSSAQFPPQRTKNLKVLPSDIPIRALLDSMSGFTRALGVRCSFCHVGNEGEPLSKYDFAADDKPEKQKAREMLRMVSAINGEHLTKLGTRLEPRVVVTCATCHRGIAEPRPLQQVLLTAYDAGGVDSADALYRTLRQRYYGRASYDFGDVALADVATALMHRDRVADAVRLYLLNTQFSPTSAFAFRQAATGQLAAGDTAAAVASLERALAISPEDRQTKAALERLTKKP